MTRIHTIYLLLILSIGYVACQYFLNEIILTEDHYYESLKEQLSYQRIENILAMQDDWKWLGYLFMPLFLCLKLGVIALCLLAGAFLFNVDANLKKLFRIVVKAEFVLLLAMSIKIIWFLLTPDAYTLDDVQYFYPLSLLELFDTRYLDPWWIYPLQVLNLFEVMYWLLLALLLGTVVQKSFDDRLGMVVTSYGSGLLIWVIFITFITLNLG